ncbi:carboxypeptidase regulatory-like domain-containing protein, partial [Candidatus Roizmanbacteria bacterium]|nr:carboxypeptidase regulatory-like domain-containing protein [Candidatus Roizmanbacteria bacterium]
MKRIVQFALKTCSVSFVILILMIAFSSNTYAAGSAIILGRIYLEPNPYNPSCPLNRFYYGDNCGNDQCNGSPNYTITWTHGATTNNINNNECYWGAPRYTFEATTNPIVDTDCNGDAVDDCTLVNVQASMDNPSAVLSHWSRTTTLFDGTACKPSESGTFGASSSPSISNITVYKEGDCEWNHVWFYYMTPPPVTIGGHVRNSLTDVGIPGVAVNIVSGVTGTTVDTPITDAQGYFESPGVILQGQPYAVRLPWNEATPQIAPDGYQPPGKTDKAWMGGCGASGAGGFSYECQAAGSGNIATDCSTAAGLSGGQCNFEYDLVFALGTPTNLDYDCTNPGTSVTVSWTADPSADFYFLAVDNLTDGWTGTCPATNGPGDFCKDNIVGTTYTFTVDATARYNWWVTSTSNVTGRAPNSAVGPLIQCAPNCKNVVCTSNCGIDTNFDTIPEIQAGTTIGFQAQYESLDGNLRGELSKDTFSMSDRLGYQNFGNGPAFTSGTISGSWPTTLADVGLHTIMCRAWNDGIAEARPAATMDGPAQYPATGPVYQIEVEVVTVPTLPGPPPTLTPTPTVTPTGAPLPTPTPPPGSSFFHAFCPI